MHTIINEPLGLVENSLLIIHFSKTALYSFLFPYIFLSSDTAYAKNKETGKWYGFDDSHVQEVKSVEQMVVSDFSHHSLLLCKCLFFCQSASAYVLFYRRRTEGTRIPPQLNRSLSVSYAEEMRERGKKFRGAPSASSDSMELDSNKIEEADEEKGETVDAEVQRYVLVMTSACYYSSSSSGQ